MINKRKLLCFIGLHNPLHCFKYTQITDQDEREIDLTWQGIWAYDIRPVITSPWSRFTTIETRYKCADCNKKFWFTSGDMDEMKINQKVIELINDK